MELSEILNGYFSEGQFNDLFIQMYVNTDNSLAFADFNRVHDTSFTHKQILKAIQDLTGSKVVKYRQPSHSQDLCLEFTDAYEFGTYKVAKDWNLYLYEMFGEVLPRGDLLSWIAKQHPKKVQGSFLPTHDGNLYAKEESVSRPSKPSEESGD